MMNHSLRILILCVSTLTALGATQYDDSHLAYWQHSAQSSQLVPWRHLSVVMLGRLADPRSVDVLTTIMQHDTEPRVRGSAAAALGRIGDAAALSTLTYVMKHDEDPHTRSAARQAIDRIQTKLRLRAEQKERLDKSPP